MNRIHRLQEDTVSKIAAGEVVERPSAIIKELFENSVDAQSTEISVEIESGGKDLIRISDNGTGIRREDADLLFERHATSKIRSIGDLYSLTTMGFRGEALHSIAAVSRMTLVSRTADEESGMKIVVMGGVVRERGSCPANVGTTIQVTDIFYNTPVRWKFMKTTTHETRSCMEIMNKLAVANSHISVTFYVDGKLVFKTDGRGDLLSCVFQIFGRTVAEEMMKITLDTSSIRISGLSSKFSLRKRNRNYMFTFVNGRYVKSQELNRVIEGCYRSHLMGGEFPIGFFFIDIDPSEIDVNVHPAKTEIKFADLRAVSTALTSALKTAIHLHTHIPSVSNDARFSKKYGTDVRFSENDYAQERSGGNHAFTYMAADSDRRSEYRAFSPENGEEGFERLKAAEERRNEDSFEGKIGSFRKTAVDNTQKMIFEEEAARGIVFEEAVAVEERANSEGEREDGGYDEVRNFPVETRMISENAPPPQQELAETRNLFLESKILGVFDRTFILMEYRSELYVIDQHAAHEKVLFEAYTQSVANKKVPRQILLIPFEMSVDSAAEIPFLEDLGFEVEPFGQHSVIVRAIPNEMTETFAKNVLQEVFDEGWDVKTPYDLATKACKAAIKGGDVLLDCDIRELLDRLFELEDPFNCPHGRPVMVKFTRKDLDKLFKRML